MKVWLKTLKVSPGFLSSERIVLIRTDVFDREHFVDESCLKGDLVQVSCVYEIRDGLALIDLPYCCDPFKAWVPEESLVYELFPRQTETCE